MKPAFPQPLIALWKVHPGDLLGEPIQFLTHGEFTHAGFLRSDGRTICEAYLPKVRCRPVIEAEKPGILLFELEGMNHELAAKFERFFDLAIDPKFVQDYSISGLFGFALNVPPPDEFHVFCSEFVMQAIRKLAPSLIPENAPDYKVSPVDLSRSTRLHQRDWP